MSETKKPQQKNAEVLIQYIKKTIKWLLSRGEFFQFNFCYAIAFGVLPIFIYNSRPKTDDLWGGYGIGKQKIDFFLSWFRFQEIIYSA